MSDDDRVFLPTKTLPVWKWVFFGAAIAAGWSLPVYIGLLLLG